MLSSFEMAEKIPHKDNKAYMTFVVIGGGPTGVEVAGAIAEIAKKTLINDFRHIDSSKAKIYLIEGYEQILASYPKKLSLKASKYLKELGVEVLTSSRVTEITKDYVKIGSLQIETRNIVWAAGNKANALLLKLDTPLDRMGRVKIKEDLSLPDDPNIFVLGDAAAFTDEYGETLPGLAPVASQQGRFLGKILLTGKRQRFAYIDKGQMATIGKFKAIAVHKKMFFSGFVAWMLWCFVHILFLIDFRSKVLVSIQWFLALFVRKRGVRLIYSKNNELEEPLRF